jgi:hypothetical protein
VSCTNKTCKSGAPRGRTNVELNAPDPNNTRFLVDDILDVLAASPAGETFAALF